MTKSRLKQNWNAFWENNRQNDSFRLSLVVSMMVLLLFVTNAAGDLEPLTNVDYTIVSKISKIILFLLLVYNIRPILRRMTGEKILGLAFVALLFLASFCVSKDRALLRSMFLHYCLTVLPIIVVVSCIADYKVLIDSLVWVSRIIGICAVALLILKRKEWIYYSMGLANSLTLPAVLLFFNSFRSKNIVDFLLGGLVTLAVFILGSRGALLEIIFFFSLLLIIGCKRKDTRLMSIFFILLIGILAVFYKPVLSGISIFLEKSGWSSRTLQLLLKGEITIDSGRNYLYDSMRNELIAHPFSIRGIGGELPFAYGFYAHNFIFELLMDFGVILGGIAVLYILYQSGRTLWEAVRWGDTFRMVKLIFFSVSIPLAMVSGTIWTAVYLWCWLVLCDKRYPTPVKRAVKASDEGKLLSIVVPTKGRYAHLFSLMELCASFSSKEFELVIQDNATDNHEIMERLSKDAYGFVAYHHDPSSLTASENGELALQHAHGRYVCVLEEDDLLSEKLVDFVAYMEQEGIDSAVFNTARYTWPRAARGAHRLPDLIIGSFDGQMHRINVRRAYHWFLRTGAARQGHLPQLHLGVVRRAVIDQAREADGICFSSPDPHMAVGAALAPFVNNHVFFNAPLVSSGSSIGNDSRAGIQKQGERSATQTCGRDSKINGLLHSCCQIGTLAYAAYRQVSDKLLMTIRLGGVLVDALPNTVVAQKRIDEEIVKIPLPF